MLLLCCYIFRKPLILDAYCKFDCTDELSSLVSNLVVSMVIHLMIFPATYSSHENKLCKSNGLSKENGKVVAQSFYKGHIGCYETFH